MKHKIKIHVRTLTAPTSGVDFDVVLSDTKTVRAALKTTKGAEVFDGTNLIGIATHLFYIRSLTGQTAEDWLEFKNNYYDILSVEDYDEAGRFQELRCSLRGDKNDPVNLA